jgi:hypothetical protein
MSLRVQWMPFEDGLHLLSEPYLSYFETEFLPLDSFTVYPKLYFSYNSRTQQTTIITTDLNQFHLSMIQHLKQMSGLSIRPEEIAHLAIQCFVMIQEGYTAAALEWDTKATGPVCCRKSPFVILLDALTLLPNSKWRHYP